MGGPGGAPDAPHAANDITNFGTEGSGVGQCKELSALDLIKQKSDYGIKLKFVQNLPEVNDGFEGGGGRYEIQWNGILWKQQLYVFLGRASLPEGSKEGFISLLEYAEEVLNCEQVVICFDKSRGDRAALVRLFKFLGFNILAPNHHLSLPATGLISMAYAIG